MPKIFRTQIKMFNVLGLLYILLITLRSVVEKEWVSCTRHTCRASLSVRTKKKKSMLRRLKILKKNCFFHCKIAQIFVELFLSKFPY